MEKIGKPIVFNICMLGSIIRMTELLTPKSILQVLETRIPPDFLDLNRQALDLGLALGDEFKT
jgi:2-oxoglutarate ferredoxin oxidoreductase subunit gamma